MEMDSWLRLVAIGILSAVPEGPACDDIRARERRCCERLADALQNLGDAITAIMAART